MLVVVLCWYGVFNGGVSGVLVDLIDLANESDLAVDQYCSSRSSRRSDERVVI